MNGVAPYAPVIAALLVAAATILSARHVRRQMDRRSR